MPADPPRRDQRDADASTGARAAAAVLGSWDLLIELATRLQPDDWSLPTPCPDTDVGALITHLAGVHVVARGSPGTRDALVDGLRDARAAQAAQIEAWRSRGRPPAGAADPPARQRRLLGAHCLDLWVHTYDLAAAVGQPVDLHDDSPALQAACGYVLEHLPRLVALRCGLAEDTAVRVVLRGAVTHDAAVAVRGGRELWELQRGSADHEITGTASALVLLLSGRGDPDHWRQRGALDWSGAGGDAFVHNARLVAPIGAD